MKIADFDLTKDVLIIAEIGNNHEGSYARAEEMIGLAAQAGAGAVKFQTIVPEELVSIQDEKRKRQLEGFRLSYQDFEKLSQVARRERVLFLSTPFDIESARFLEPLVPAFKIASGDNNFFPLIDVVAKTGKPIILSGGLSDLSELKITRDRIQNLWRQKGIGQELAILHCVVSYPTPPDQANLFAIRQIAQLGVTVGYSDHTLGIDAAVLSVALGARIIEKHFTLDKNFSEFHDHKIAADPEEMSRLVRRVKETLQLLGRGVKEPQEAEKPMEEKVRRSIVAKRPLEKGAVLAWEDLAWVRPGGGLRPGLEDEILGKALRRPLAKGEQIRRDDLTQGDGD